MSYRAIKNLKQKVGDMLRDNAETRDSDITLMIEIWRKYLPSKIRRGASGEEGVWLKDLYELPREDNIKRVRAYWQNTRKMYLPRDEKVAKARGINMDEWRVAMGYPTKSTAGTPRPSWTPPSEGGQEYREDCQMCYAQKQGVFVPPHTHEKMQSETLFKI